MLHGGTPEQCAGALKCSSMFYTYTQVYVEEHFCSLLLGLKQNTILCCLCLCLYQPLPLPAPMRVGHIAPPVLPLLKWVFTFPEKPAATFRVITQVLVVAHPPPIYHWAGILPGHQSPAVCTVYKPSSDIIYSHGSMFHAAILELATTTGDWLQCKSR